MSAIFCKSLQLGMKTAFARVRLAVQTHVKRSNFMLGSKSGTDIEEKSREEDAEEESRRGVITVMTA